MARGRNKRGNRKRKVRRTKSRNIRATNPRPRRTTVQRSIGSSIVRAARDLISSLPGGSVITSLGDFVFSNILSANGLTEERIFQDPTTVIGLNAGIYPTLAACIRDAPLVAKQDRTHLYTSFTDGQLIMFSVTVEPINVISSRSGSWALMFTPFRTDKDYSTYQGKLPTYTQMLAHHGVVSGRADLPLTLTYRPTVRDGLIGTFIALDTMFGVIHIAYQEDSRTQYTQFTPSEFSARTRISAVVALKTIQPDGFAKVIECAIGNEAPKVTILHANGTSRTIERRDQASLLGDLREMEIIE